VVSDSREVHIRPCEEADLDRFAVFGSSLHVEYCRDEFRRMRNGEGAILVAVDGSDLLGKAHADLATKADEGIGCIEAVAVVPELQGRGIGSALMRATEALLADHGLATAELGVEDTNERALRLYRRLGYESVRREVFTYENVERDGSRVSVANPGQIMQKRLARVRASGPTARRVWKALAEIADPEIPVVSLVDLGVIKDVVVEGEQVRVDFTPTFMGCPALEVMEREMRHKVEELGAEATVRVVLDDSWSTDRITPEGREKLRAAGFAPPAPRAPEKLELVRLQRGFRCPYCGSTNTRLENLFGPTPCRSIRYCDDCRQPFEQFKTI
jgi:ring-1,2-phenylacetyl-CoA epoxidase subunit PaaD